MPVRWSSTYFMLERAYELRDVCLPLSWSASRANHAQAVDRFALEITLTEKDAKKREKLECLRLSDTDWAQVALIIKILSVRILWLALDSVSSSNSMRTMRNRHSHLTCTQQWQWASLRSSICTRSGRSWPADQSTRRTRTRSTLGSRRSPSTTRGRSCPMLSSCAWVCDSFLETMCSADRDP